MPSQASPEILVVEDSPTLAIAYKMYLKDLGCQITLAEKGQQALDFLSQNQPDIILLDLMLPDMSGFDILQHVRQDGDGPGVVVITAHGSVQIAVEAMQKGADDFILKPFDKGRLTTTISNLLELRRLRQLVDSIGERKGRAHFQGFVGKSPAMQAVYAMIEDAAPSQASVFIVGESGTGKELAASAIHNLSPRAELPYVTLNCAAIPASLIESEIFGHKKGAFTGATEDREGAASRADGGTLFLDELCEMPLDLQSKLLRFIQTGEYNRVGDNQTRRVDVRFVCATNRDPWREVQEGRFREDLYYRLHVIPVNMPPLRDRGDDVSLIAASFLEKYAADENKSFRQIDDQARAVLMNHPWPGNVRELSNVIQSAVVLNNGEVLTADMLPIRGRVQPVSERTRQVGPASDEAAVSPAMIRPLEQVERDAIEHALALCDGKVHKAARALQVNPSTLYRKLKAWGQQG